MWFAQKVVVADTPSYSRRPVPIDTFYFILSGYGEERLRWNLDIPFERAAAKHTLPAAILSLQSEDSNNAALEQ